MHHSRICTRLVRLRAGRRGVKRDYVLAMVKATEAEGFRDSQLHQLAMKLHDQQSLHPSEQGKQDAADQHGGR